MRINDDPTRVHRMSLLYRYTENVYHADVKTLPGTLPDRRAISAPIVGWSYQEMDFIKETFIDRAERIEDINLGHEFTSGIGYSAPLLGATESAFPYTFAHHFGFGGDGPWFGLSSYGTSGRYNTYSSGQPGGGYAPPAPQPVAPPPQQPVAPQAAAPTQIAYPGQVQLPRPVRRARPTARSSTSSPRSSPRWPAA